MTRLLMHMGLIEKKGTPGRRRVQFHVKEDVWADIVSSELSRMRQLREMAERGLGLLSETPLENQQRLLDMREMFAFAEREMSFFSPSC
jgi:DNA-binding transcriptional regulator GbsR (MarR family)